MFQKERLLDIIKNFIFFSNEGTQTFKILAGYHQYFAVNKAIASTKKAAVTDGKGGMFWHTQGSGKSLSKVAYPKFLEKLSVCRDKFHGYNYSKFANGTDLERAKTISGAVNFIIGREKVEDKDSFVKEALMLHQALSLCSSLVDAESRFETAFFESVRVLILRLTNTGVGKKISLPEMNARINELLKQSIKSDGVINLFFLLSSVITVGSWSIRIP